MTGIPGATVHTVDARKLAWWAEEAHGKQGTPLYIVVDEGGNAQMTDKLNGKQPLLEVETTGPRPGLLRPRELKLKVSETRTIDLLDDARFPGCDALFWTVSSIEKFLFPYYYSQRLFSDNQMKKLRAEYLADRTLIAAAHRAPSRVRLIFMEDEYEPEIDFTEG